uniref:caspase family protein n=1 Tax=Rheinheimera sp. TaxID=1869214 RepID=UPI004048A0C9
MSRYPHSMIRLLGSSFLSLNNTTTIGTINIGMKAKRRERRLLLCDACRDNPIMTASSRWVTRGLAPINVSEGTLISYATKDGQTAADGTGQKNSPYTAALLEHLGDPQDIGIVLRTVRAKVMQRTDNRQQPWEYGSLTGGALVLSTIKK